MQGKASHSQQTEMNLLQAFAGESQANRKYLAFAKQAEKEGHPQVAKLFRAAAEAETVHAHAHLRALGKIGTTEENLKAAIAGETYEFTEMYPAMIQTAKQEEDQVAQDFLARQRRRVGPRLPLPEGAGEPQRPGNGGLLCLLRLRVYL